MNVKVVGYYTSDACYSGEPEEWNSSVTKIVIEDREGERKVVSPSYLPIISPPLVPPQTNPSECYYRASLKENLPYNYYLWQRGKLCRGRERMGSCAPVMAEILDTPEDIAVFEKDQMPPPLKRLPADEEELEAFLLQAEKEEQLIWMSDDNREAYNILQWEIDTALSGQDVHVVFGVGHAVEGQTAFFNELIAGGEDGFIIGGVTHLALEIARTNSIETDAQGPIDYYLVTGRKVFGPLRSSNWKTIDGKELDIAMASEKEVKDKNFTLELGYRGCYNIVLANISREISDGIKKRVGEYYALAVRENFAVKSVEQRQDPGQREVIFWKWGASHVEKQRLPFYIRIQDPKAKVVVVVLNGGTYVDALAFDRVLSKMGWLERKFILRLEGYREADYVIHLPTQGREKWWGISRVGNPVIQHIFDKPE